MLLINILLYALAFFAIWFGSGLIVTSATKFSHHLKLSPFAFSFVFLGLLTSTPEFSVGLQAVADKNADIFVGNLLGGIVVIFLVIIPLLAVFGNGVSLKHELDNRTLLATLVVIIAPAFFIIDKRVTNLEGIIMIASYFVLLFIVERKKGIFDSKNSRLLNINSYSLKDILKILVGIGIVFVSSNIIVEKTLYFADVLQVSSFYIGLILVALGTDLPELSLAVRSVISGKKEVAMGDYIGAAAVSTFLFGLFTLLHHGEVITISNFALTLTCIAAALVTFYILFRTKNFISRRNGCILLIGYIVFVLLELLK